MKFGVADYGMNVWDGECFDSEERWKQLRAIGYEGVERLNVTHAEEAVWKAAALRKLGMDFTTMRGPTAESSIRLTAAFGKAYTWTVSNHEGLDHFCRQVNIQVEACERYGIHLALHNHMGTAVETQEQLVEFMSRCPKTKLLLDVGHLAAMKGDPIEMIFKYADRLEVIHIKDWMETDSNHKSWSQRGYFCGLGEGNIGLDNAAVMKALQKIGFDSWVFVEQDTHLQEPLEDLAKSRQFLRNLGF
jgi:sugar phosphate isomerase/epimerase